MMYRIKKLYKFLTFLFIRNSNKKKDKLKQKLSYEDVFVSSGEPIYTYYPREEKGLEEKVLHALKSRKLTVVEGPSKVGKTVLIRKVLPKKRAIWINGGSIKSEDEFWDSLMAQLHLCQTVKMGSVAETLTKSFVDGRAELGLPFNKVSSSASVGVGVREGVTAEKVQQIYSKTSVLRALESNPIPIVIDDFHFISSDLRSGIIKSFKGLIFDGLPIVIITVRSRKKSAFKMTSEMTGRILTVSVPLWEDSELINIPQMGLGRLGCSVGTWQLEKLTTQSLGIPHLIQDFCYEICKNSILKDEGGVNWNSVTPDDFDKAFSAVAENLGRRIFEELVKFPNQEMSEERSREVHLAVLEVIAQMNRAVPQLSLSVTKMHEIIESICPTLDMTQAELIASLEMLSKVATKDDSSIPVIEYDKQNKECQITDPLFAFYVNITFK